MKSVMLSIRPKWCELITSGKKTVEVRKTRPKVEMPFKCYIYETKGKTEIPTFIDEEGHEMYQGRGQVIGEFVCDEIAPITPSPFTEGEYIVYGLGRPYLRLEEYQKYLGKKGGYGWHISDLVIYDKPKELCEFYNSCGVSKLDVGLTKKCWKCDYYEVINGSVGCTCYTEKPITRPPQSWCYVESEVEE